MTSILMPEQYAHCVFVFGSNLSGVHGAGSARTAREHYGAVMGKGIGRMGQSYAIPTKDHSIQTLPIVAIQGHVNTFLLYAAEHPATSFYVTPIGTGLAGYTHDQIAPLFSKAPLNCILPIQWKQWIV